LSVLTTSNPTEIILFQISLFPPKRRSIKL